MRDQPKKQKKPTSSKCVHEKMSKAMNDYIVPKNQTVVTGPVDTTITADIHRNLTQFVESCDQLDIPVNDANQQKCEGTGLNTIGHNYPPTNDTQWYK